MRSLCERWPMSASPKCKRGKRSVVDQGMDQDYGIKIDYGTPGPILEYIEQDQDENIMESGQDLNRARRSQCRWPCRGRGKRSVEDQDMVQEQDQDENIMESGQDLNRKINFCSTWCRRCTRSSWWCRSCPKCRRGKRSVGVEDQGMDQEQDAVVSPPGFAYSDLN